MPSPVGHALGGLIVALACAPQSQSARVTPNAWHARLLTALRVPAGSLPLLTWCMVAACLPDIDFAWGRHNMETHSAGFALLLGGLTLLGRRSPRMAVATTLAVITHVLFDWLGSDDSPPLGVMALWPWSDEFYYSHAWVFAAISRRYWRDDFVSQNVLAILRELVLLLPVVAAIGMFRRRRR